MDPVRYDSLYLSPHPDDAVFSSGGAIALEARAGRRVGVVTVFSHTGDATESVRRDEDTRAIELLGAERIELGLADAPVRDRRYLRPWWILGTLGEREAAVLDEVRRALRPLVSEAARVVAPLAVGRHIDHQVVHEAARRMDVDVEFYEDMPYSLDPWAAARRLARLGTGGPSRADLDAEVRALRGWMSAMPLIRDTYRPWSRPLATFVVSRMEMRAVGSGPAPAVRWTEARVDVSAAMDAKMSAIAAYGTQWPMFVDTIDEWRGALDAYASRVGATAAFERRWRPLAAAMRGSAP